MERENMIQNITFRAGSCELLEDIKELWEELNCLHYEKSLDFKQHYKTFSFSSRKEHFRRAYLNGGLYVLIAYFNEKKLGYCVASVVDEVGEIESLYVDAKARGAQIGAQLMKRSLDWLRKNEPKKIVVKVAAGNEEVFEFYKKFGFAPRLTELQLK